MKNVRKGVRGLIIGGLILELIGLAMIRFLDSTVAGFIILAVGGFTILIGAIFVE